MANEIQLQNPTGRTLYAIIMRSTDGSLWNTSTPAFETINSAHWTNYAITLTEQSTATGLYLGTFPTGISAFGAYTAFIYSRAGGSAATTDSLAGSQSFNWDGAADRQFESRDSSGAGALQAAAYQTITQLLTGHIVTTYVKSTGVPATDGATLASAISAAVSGTLIFFSEGTFALSAAVLNLPAGVSLMGTTKYGSIITSTAILTTLGCIVCPGTGSHVSRMTIQGVATAGSFQAPFGCNVSASTPQSIPAYFTASDLNLLADSDGLYFSGGSSPTAMRGRLENIESTTKYDTFNMVATGATAPWAAVLDLINPIFVATYLPTFGSSPSRGISVFSGKVRVFSGSVTASGGYTETSAVVTNNVGAVELYGTLVQSFAAQSLSITATGGTYTLSVTAMGSTQTTAAIAYNASNSTIQTSLAALSNVGTANVTVGSGIVVFSPSLGPLAFTINPASLTGGSGTITANACYDLHNASGTLVADNASYDPSKTSGTITQINPPIGKSGTSSQIAVGALATGAIVPTTVNGNLPANAVQIGGTTQTGRDIGVSVLLSAGTGTGQLDFTSGVVKANLWQMFGTSITSTIAAAWVKAWNVASSAWTSADVPQTGDNFARIGTNGASLTSLATASSQTSILNAVSAITTNTARGKLVLPYWLVRPSSGSAAYEIDVNLYALSGQLEAPDAAPTIHARNAAGTSMDAGLSATTMTLIATGRYKATYTVNNTDTAQEVIFDVAWAVGGVSFYVADATEVQDAEITATLLAVKAKTDNLPSDPASQATTNASISSSTSTISGLLSTQGTAISNIPHAVWSDSTTYASGTKGNAVGGGGGGGGGGDGSNKYVIRIFAGSQAVEGAQVFVTSDVDGDTLVAQQTSDGNGNTTFFLDDGTYYRWAQHPRFNFTNPSSFSVP